VIYLDFEAASAGRPEVTWNPLDTFPVYILLSNGNLTAEKIFIDGGDGDNLRSTRATYGIPHTESGYFEAHIDFGAIPGLRHIVLGVGRATASVYSYPGGDADGWGYFQDTGTKYTSGSAAAYGSGYGTNDVIGVAFKNGKLWFAKNNTWQNSGDPAADTGEAFSGITGTISPMACVATISSGNQAITARFKSSDFTYSPPSGFDPWGT
jgi:hypothetical protein